MEKWTTENEIAYLSQLRAKNALAFRNAARFILADARQWDPGIDVDAIKAACRRLMEGL